MALSIQAQLDAPVIELDTVDSTNNYAMQLIDADTAQPGLTILTRAQTNGKGQRGKSWEVEPGQNVLMSMVLSPERTADAQFPFLVAVAVAAADTVREYCDQVSVYIKWPNDIIVNDKKAAGILIENLWKGSSWSASVVGLGLNVRQESFPPELAHVTSLKMASGMTLDVSQLAAALRERIIRYTNGVYTDADLLARYHQYLYRRGHQQEFESGGQAWRGIVVSVTPDGQLEVQHSDGSLRRHQHGTLIWKW